MTTLADIHRDICGQFDVDYQRRMFHRFPEGVEIERERWILSRCMGKIVLDIGCSGYLHEHIIRAAKKAYGIDKVMCAWDNFVAMDLEKDPLPVYPDVELVLCGEVIEHLSNPGFFLEKLHFNYGCPVIVTVPNAMADVVLRHAVKRGLENVNIEHVAYYSPRTFRTLAERHGFRVCEMNWYRGKPPTSEGLVFVIERV